MKKPLFACCVMVMAWCLLPLHSTSQVIIPNTPSSASLMKEVERPTVASTGVPNIFIPLLNETMRGNDFPVNLRYNAGGFKVDEESGWVGLGWYLDCEFQITRKINGLDDFLSNGYPKAATTSPLAAVGSTIPNTSTFYQTQYQLAVGSLDGEPDEFTYRLRNGKSGKFYFRPNATSFVPVTTSDPKMKVTFNAADYSFKIIDSDGTTYFFAAKSGAEFKATDGFEMSSDVDGQHKSVITWKCIKIQDFNNRNEIVFSYTAREKLMKIRGRSHTQLYTEHQNFLPITNYPPIYARNITWNFASYEAFARTNPFYRLADAKYFIKADGLKDRFNMLDSGTPTPTLQSQYVKQGAISAFKKIYAQLSSITLNGSTTITFDLTSSLEELKSIAIKKGSTPIRTINFYLSKPSVTSGTYQFSTSYLDSLIIVGGQSIAREKYGFRYYSKPVFGALWEGSDAWGYFNSSSSNTPGSTIPSIELHEPYNFILGDQAPNVEYPHESFSLSGVLTDILYPTGGFTNYSYENHRYKYQYRNLGDNADLPNQVYNRDEIGTAILLAGGLRIKAIRHYNGRDLYPEMSSIFSYGQDGTGQLVNEQDVGLAGFMSVFSYPPNSYQGWTFTPFSSVRYVNYLALSANSTYTNANRFYIATRDKLTTYRPRKFALNANGYGSSVFYDKITEYLTGKDSVIGKIEDYYYKPREISPVYASDNLAYSIYIPETDLPKIKNYWYMDVKKKTMRYGYRNGAYFLKEENRYTYNSNNLVATLPVYYSYMNQVYEQVGSIEPGLQTENENFPNLFSNVSYEGSDMILYDPNTNYANGTAFSFGRYDLPLGYNYLASEEEITYENNGLDSIKRTTSYSYRSGFDTRISTIKELDSKNAEKTTQLTYPDDSTRVAAYNSLTLANNVSEILGKKITSGGSSLKEDRVFQIFPEINKAFLSANILYHNGILSKTTALLKYDSYGNPLESVEQAGKHTVYVWGNQGERLLFTLENLTYDAFTAGLNTQGGALSLLNGLNANGVTAATIENVRQKLYTVFGGVCMVTSYKYNGQGLLSSTENARRESNSYYYDDLQRLTSVVDQDGNIVRSHNYSSRSANSNWFKDFNDLKYQYKDISLGDMALNGFARMQVNVYFDISIRDQVKLKLQHIQSGQIFEYEFSYESSRLGNYNFYNYNVDLLLPLGDYNVSLENDVSRFVFISNELIPSEDFWSYIVEVVPKRVTLKSTEDKGYYFISLSGAQK